jgi:hypothetical protein
MAFILGPFLSDFNFILERVDSISEVESLSSDILFIDGFDFKLVVIFLSKIVLAFLMNL